MSWAAVAGAAVGVVGSQLSKDKNGGAGSTTASKEPWSQAQPWLVGQLQQGSELQDQYNKNPFSAQQNQAYANQYAQSDYMRSLVPSLLSQLQGQQVGFDPSNPTAKPKAFTWDASGGLLGGSGGGSSGSMTQAMQAQAAADAARAGAKPAADTGFRNQADTLSGANFTGYTPGSTGMLGSGGMGSFTYGMDVKPGTQAYRDLQEYRLMGGSDPNNLYGWGAAPAVFQNAGGS